MFSPQQIATLREAVESFDAVSDDQCRLLMGSGMDCYDLAVDVLERVQAEAELRAEIEDLRAIIARMDEAFPLADETCEEPGITLSEAVRRERAEAQQHWGRIQ